jgi:hypothetical protein
VITAGLGTVARENNPLPLSGIEPRSSRLYSDSILTTVISTNNFSAYGSTEDCILHNKELIAFIFLLGLLRRLNEER